MEQTTDNMDSATSSSHGYNTISILSDYGMQDEFVAALHSVVVSISPHVRIIDITHNIGRHNVRAGSLALARIAPYLPSGVVLGLVGAAEVDTIRPVPVAIEVGGGSSVLVGPDNGLFGPAVALVGGADRAVRLSNTTYHLRRSYDTEDTLIGKTFNGRDVYAPSAAHLCAGVPLDKLGERVSTASLTPAMLPVSSRENETLIAEVLWVDAFGNCQLNVTADDLDLTADDLANTNSHEPRHKHTHTHNHTTSHEPNHTNIFELVIGDNLHTARLSTTYCSIGASKVGLLVDSYGLLSIAINKGSAADELSLREGSEVRITQGFAQQRQNIGHNQNLGQSQSQNSSINVKLTRTRGQTL